MVDLVRSYQQTLCIPVRSEDFSWTRIENMFKRFDRVRLLEMVDPWVNPPPMPVLKWELASFLTVKALP